MKRQTAKRSQEKQDFDSEETQARGKDLSGQSRYNESYSMDQDQGFGGGESIDDIDDEEGGERDRNRHFHWEEDDNDDFRMGSHRYSEEHEGAPRYRQSYRESRQGSRYGEGRNDEGRCEYCGSSSRDRDYPRESSGSYPRDRGYEENLSGVRGRETGYGSRLQGSRYRDSQYRDASEDRGSYRNRQDEYRFREDDYDRPSRSSGSRSSYAYDEDRENRGTRGGRGGGEGPETWGGYEDNRYGNRGRSGYQQSDDLRLQGRSSESVSRRSSSSEDEDEFDSPSRGFGKRSTRDAKEESGKESSIKTRRQSNVKMGSEADKEKATKKKTPGRRGGRPSASKSK